MRGLGRHLRQRADRDGRLDEGNIRAAGRAHRLHLAAAGVHAGQADRRQRDRQAVALAEEVDGIKIIRHKVSRQDMAKVVGASREMVSRVMKDLEERGVIETQENGSVVLKDRVPPNE